MSDTTTLPPNPTEQEIDNHRSAEYAKARQKLKHAVHFSSASTEHATPQNFYDELHKEFQFELDPASTHENAKCLHHYTKEDNGLIQPWAPKRVFCNPPYGRGITGQWVRKASEEQKKGGLSVLLLPARTDTQWFHNFIYDAPIRRFHPNVEVRFVRGRLKFGDSKDSAPFPSMVVIFRPYRFPSMPV